MTWQCAAIDHGVTIFPSGKIGPCCQISSDYLKPIEVLSDANRFADLKTTTPPAACERCTKNESQGLPSYRRFFNSYHNIKPESGIVFLDIRNTNQCNLKCRYCNPHFSNQWAKELDFKIPLLHADLSDILDQILTDDLKLIYFTGGEPMISGDHWKILNRLVDSGSSKNIKLMYNTNFTNLTYKNNDFFKIWDNFSRVDIQASIDSTGDVFDFIRSGANWKEIEKNLDLFIDKKKSNMNLSVSCVVSILNIWKLPEFIEYFLGRHIPVNFIVLSGPDYLALDVIPDELRDLALSIIDKAIALTNGNFVLKKSRELIINNQNQVLFRQCISHVLMLDSIRNENLFELLPFKDIAKQMILNNHEYE